VLERRPVQPGPASTRIDRCRRNRSRRRGCYLAGSLGEGPGDLKIHGSRLRHARRDGVVVQSDPEAALDETEQKGLGLITTAALYFCLLHSATRIA
jgi:hypothetical protein